MAAHRPALIMIEKLGLDPTKPHRNLRADGSFKVGALVEPVEEKEIVVVELPIQEQTLLVLNPEPQVETVTETVTETVEEVPVEKVESQPKRSGFKKKSATVSD